MLAVNGGVLSKTEVAPGETFELSGFGSNTEITLEEEGGNGEEVDAFHTSCSAPLETGDIFGNLELVAFDGQRCSATVTYEYRVINDLGDPVTDILVVDDKLGQIGTIPAPPTDDGSDILKDVLLSSPAEITSDEWQKGVKDRTLKTGDGNKEFKLEFDAKFPDKKDQSPSDFELEVIFEQGCSVTF